MTEFEKVVARSVASIVCYTDAAQQTFKFMDLKRSRTADLTQPLEAGWTFVGVVGTDLDGNISSALNLGEDFQAIARLCEAFTDHVKGEWAGLELERWGALPDTRTVN